ncbi:MAG: FAD-dependent monooxygenase [Salinivirgaceae bacterium]|nr:FAD-dependent monooxygenase [Salinivirgaceae bacterium]
MEKEITLVLSPKQASSTALYTPLIANKLKVSLKQISYTKVINRSIDARGRNVKINLKLLVCIDSPPKEKGKINIKYKNVKNSEPVLIIGAGPAGLFAALKLLEIGLKPIIIERGKDVISRKRDIADIHKNKALNPDSNYAFGEGGAGTFSDGKLYTRSKKRGSNKNVLNVLTQHGASEDILIDAHPHIGSDKLPGIIKSIRESIIEYGGEIHFNTCLKSLLIESNSIKGIVTKNNEKIESRAVILATGHSARDVYFMLNELGIMLEAKSFAMGVRIEHPQELIDSIQYSCDFRGPYLPAASYGLVQQVKERGVYSFCMCPGGIIVPASTAADEMVVNGMSPSNRNTRWANSGIVVEIRPEDIKNVNINALIGLDYQQKFEKLAFANGGEGQIAPAQNMVDFVEGRISNKLAESSFRPSIQTSAMHEWIPEQIRFRLQEGFKAFGKKMKGYYTNEATLIGVESRTSSPVRIPRDRETMQHPQIKGLFPSGEGSGYAGGITSSAIDGENTAVKVDEYLK